ncbi:MAG: molecular chaperone DnaJ [Chloroflexota bacterium]
MNRDYYRVLGVGRNATPEEVKKAFRRLAFQHHPDRNRDEGAEGRFKEINEAYQVLSDPERRASYDRYGMVDVGGLYGRGFEGFDFGGLGDIFDAFFGGAARVRRGPRRGADVNVQFTISFEEAVFGCEREVEVRRVEPCARCRGTGCQPGTSPERCANCGGSGEVQRVERSIFGRFVNVVPCDRCGGEGKVVLQPCTGCSGRGRERRLCRLVVRIPPGVDDGFQVCLSAEGDSGLWGGPSGDLYVQLTMSPHPLFQRDGQDILYELPLNFAQAALGDRVEVPTLDGPMAVEIPAGTQNGDAFRLKGRGAPSPGGGRRGDQLARVRVVTPTSLDERQRELLRELKDSLGHSQASGGKKKRSILH